MYRLRRFARQEAGGSLALFVVVLPLLLTVLGVVVDTGLYGLSVVRLSSAADSAALAAASAVDMEHYQATGEVRLVLSKAEAKARTYAAANYDGVLETIVTVPATNPRKVQVLLRTRLQTVFLRLFGVSEIRLEAGADAQVG